MRILIATDFSDAADVALREGAEMASKSTDDLAILHVVRALPRELLFVPVPDAGLTEVAQEILERARAATQERVATIAPRAQVFIDEGVDYAAIVHRAESWRADVIAVGDHGRSGLRRALGSVTERVVRHAHCSVLVARKSDSRGWVIAATDLSDASLTAISVAAEEAIRRHARIKVVHSKGFIDLEVEYLMQITPSIAQRPPQPEPVPKTVSDLLAKLGVEPLFEQLDPPAASAIVREAESIGAELIVVGARGATGLARLAIGSVAERVVHAAPCSVLVARIHDQAHHR